MDAFIQFVSLYIRRQCSLDKRIILRIRFCEAISVNPGRRSQATICSASELN